MKLNKVNSQSKFFQVLTVLSLFVGVISLFKLNFPVFASAVDTSKSSKGNKQNQPTKVESNHQIESHHLVEQDNFSFQLEECKQKNITISCSLIVTNLTENELNLRLFRESSQAATRFFDLSGNGYISKTVQIGSKVSEYIVAEKLLPPGIPTKASIQFDLIPQLEKLDLLELYYYSKSAGNKIVNFHNVDISESKPNESQTSAVAIPNTQE